MTKNQLARVVIVGGGFAGLAAAKALRNTAAKVILIDRTNHHLFQPLLYQVATSLLTPGQIATPIRSILRNQTDLPPSLSGDSRLSSVCCWFLNIYTQFYVSMYNNMRLTGVEYNVL